MAVYNAPQEVAKLDRSTKTGSSVSRSQSYDYSGADLVQKYGDALSTTSASRQSALYDGDIKTALATGRRISDLSNYINAYRASGGAGGMYDGVFGEVAPRVRIASESGTNSSDRSQSNDTTLYASEKYEAPELPRIVPNVTKPAKPPERFMPVRPIDNLPNNNLIMRNPVPRPPPPGTIMSRKPDPVPEYPATSSSMFGFNFPSVFVR